MPLGIFVGCGRGLVRPLRPWGSDRLARLLGKYRPEIPLSSRALDCSWPRSLGENPRGKHDAECKVHFHFQSSLARRESSRRLMNTRPASIGLDDRFPGNVYGKL